MRRHDAHGVGGRACRRTARGDPGGRSTALAASSLLAITLYSDPWWRIP